MYTRGELNKMTDYEYYQDGEEIEDVQETRKLIGPNSYSGDTWELIRYTGIKG
jgi:hypothetical protein